MSALDYITEYGSSADECDEETVLPDKKIKLRVPNLSKVQVIPLEKHCDNPNKHQGRVRSFPHERGDWACYAFVKYTEQEILHNFVNTVERTLQEEINDCIYKCEDFHISLSKTVVLKYHQITLFTKSLQECLDDIECFELEFASVKVYCNEEGTRTFLAVEVDYFTKKFLQKITHKVDDLLKEFRLPLFYEDPSFHMSILWMNGNKKAEILAVLEKFNKILSKEIENSLTSVVVNHINCKIGNKYYQFSLK